MKGWQAIVANLAVVGLTAITQDPTVVNSKWGRPITLAIAGISIAIANATSKSNPDGTPAQVSWQKPADKILPPTQ